MMADTETIHCERGGRSGPMLALLHGLGANGAVWDGLKPLLAQHWRGRWLIPDFRGHGRSFHRAPYGIGIHAADVAALVQQDEEMTIIGHSMGGVVGIALATGMFGVRVRRVVAFGVKVDWTEDDVSRAQAVAHAPPRMFATKDEAIERYLRVAGLKGIVAPDSAAAERGISEQQGQFRLAADPLTNALGTPDFARLAQAANAPLHLLCGERDSIARAESMRRLGAAVTELPGLGHNLHVEAPQALWQAIEADVRV
jgi:pimeloyl-ACP methyl ester carboxylesterase